MTNVHLAFSNSDESAPRPTALDARSMPESSQDMLYTVVARKVQAQVIGELTRHALERVRHAVRRTWHWYLQQAAERRTVAELRRLDDHLLRDIGINRFELDAQVHARLSAASQSASVVALDSRRRPDDGCQPTDRAA